MTAIPDREATRHHLLLSIVDVAAELGCGRDTVYALLGSGALPSVQIGQRLRRVRRSDLTAYVDALTTSRPAGTSRGCTRRETM